MTVNGIIAEYNPFHKGHAYQLNNAKKTLNADRTVVIMSGNFVQRGEPAFMDKFARTKAALLGGADLVLESPAYAATASAESFAFNAVRLLDELNIVDNLCFGSESKNITSLQKISDILVNEPLDFKNYLKNNLAKGQSFPQARQNALSSYDKDIDISIINEPNNILAIEYLKAINKLNSTIKPFNTKRIGQGYNEESSAMLHSDGGFASALSIRTDYENNNNLTNVAGKLPDYAFDIIKKQAEEKKLITTSSLDSLLRYKLFSESNQGYEKYLDVTPELSNRIINNLHSYTNFNDFALLIKSKNITLSHVKRALLHILLDMTNEKNMFFTNEVKPYAKILGFNSSSKDILSLISKNSDIPIISKYADYKKILDNNQQRHFEEEIRINQLYQCLFPSSVKSKSEYSMPIIFV